MAAIELLVVVFLGLIFGSFATALIYRVTRGISWHDKSRSSCPQCKTVLRVPDLIPVFSWLLILRGKCRTCKTSISRLYPLTELCVVLACLGVYAVYGLTLESAIIMLSVPFLAALLVIDLEYMILPNQLVIITGVLGLAWLGVQYWGVMPSQRHGLLADHIGGAFVYAGFILATGWVVSKVLRKEALGFGDVKFFFASGLWLGLSNMGWYCMASGIFGVAFGLGWQVLKKDRVFPFGPALIAALYVLLLLDGSLLL